MKVSRPKKILIHSNYRPENHGGIELVVKLIINSLPRADYEITCFFGDMENSNSVINDRLNYISRRILMKFAGACILSWGNVKFLLDSLKSELIVFQEPYPTLWPAMFIIRNILRKKVIVLVHANPVSKKLIMKIYGLIRSLVFNGSICVTTSPSLLKEINCSFFERALVIPLSIPNILLPSTKFLCLPVRYALYIGRLAEYKGIEYLLESAKLCPNINFVIAGDGPMAAYVSTLIAENRILNINFINRFVTEIEKFELIERASFVIFPSISENEAFGLVQLEAMKSKRAIINTWLDSGVNYVAPNNICAITVSRKSSEQLAQAICKLWNDPDLAVRLGQNGFDRFHLLFQEARFIDSWTSLINECV